MKKRIIMMALCFLLVFAPVSYGWWAGLITDEVGNPILETKNQAQQYETTIEFYTVTGKLIKTYENVEILHLGQYYIEFKTDWGEIMLVSLHVTRLEILRKIKGQ